MFSFVAGIGTSIGGFLGKLIIAVVFALVVRWALCVFSINSGVLISQTVLNIALIGTFLMTLFSGKK